MVDWTDKVGRASLTCAASNEAIEPGADFYSVLRLAESGFERIDYSAGAWKPELAEGALSWWQQRRPVPEKDSKGPRLVDHQVLLAVFRSLTSAEERIQRCFAWLLAWLLVRAKKLRYLDLIEENGVSWLVCQERDGDKATLRIRDPAMGPDEAALVQEQFDQLFTMPGGEQDEPVSDGDAGSPPT
jgi:hypothetical protein